MVSDHDILAGLIESLPGLGRSELESLVSPEISWETDVVPGGRADRNGLLDFVDEVRVAFPGWGMQVTNTFPSRDGREVAFEFVFKGANKGFLRNVGITDRAVSLTGSGVAVMDGRVLVALRTTWNCAALMAQLGVRAHMRADPLPRR